MEVNLSQFSKGLPPIFDTFSGILTDVIGQELKALLPMLVTLFGISMDVRLLQ